MRVAIVFDGENEMNLTPHDIRQIRIGSPKQLVQFFQSTAVYRSVMRDLLKDLGSALRGVNDSPVSKERILAIESGYNLLWLELVSAFGEDSAGLIAADTFNAINLEKNERTEG
jgi:hypothetical protein